MSDVEIPAEENGVADGNARLKAKLLYWSGWRLCAISEHLGISNKTLFSWKSRYKWDKSMTIERVEGALDVRLMMLIGKENKEAKDYKEVDLLMRQLERAARVRKYLNGGNEADLNPKVANRNSMVKRKPVRNAISDEQAEKLIEQFTAGQFDYQRAWHDAASRCRIRNILKSRQIGATMHFSREAFIDAIQTGRNQIFLSASKAQSHVFREYIIKFAAGAGVELSGSPIILPNGASLYFLSSNSRTAQSYHGNLYFDEYFWVQNFPELRKVASGMSMHKKWRQTYFSTPSSLHHPAHAFWSGALYNQRRPQSEQIAFDVSHGALAAGAVCADKQWRNIVTVEDAIAGGNDLFDIEQLQAEYSPEEYANLLMCQFVDDTASVFPMALVMRAMVDSWDVWPDFQPLAIRPFGDREVWIGYDPSSTGDSAAMVIVAPPGKTGGKFRLLEREQFRGMDFEIQANMIRNACLRYNVTHIAIDSTGMGQGVLQLVRNFFPAVEAIHYSVESKIGLVLKGVDVFNKGRIEFDAGWVDLAQSFMAIRKGMTDSGRQMTFKADRSAAVSHADLAWATLHALHHEPLDATLDGRRAAFIEIS
ncbi:MAG: terminase family protein [Azoarcus sp.]|jgi:uncharacterized protein YjcR|nr:terminase family protein [Azoarcus sp.]